MKSGTLGRLFLPVALMLLPSCGSGTTSELDDRVVALITVVPATPTLIVGSTIQLSATATDVNSNLVSSATFVWSSFDVEVATVNGEGLVTGLAPGTAIVDARIPGVAVTAGTASVMVVVAAGGA